MLVRMYASGAACYLITASLMALVPVWLLACCTAPSSCIRGVDAPLTHTEAADHSMRARNTSHTPVVASARGNGAALSDKEKWGIVVMLEAGHTQTAVAKQLGINRNVVGKYWKRYNLTGGVARQPGNGSKAILDTAAEDRVLELLTGGVGISAQDVSNKLHAEGVLPTAVHKSTIIRAAKRAAARAGQKLVVQPGKPWKVKAARTKR